MKLRQKLASTALSLALLSSMALTGANAQIIGGDLVFKEVKNAETVVTYSNGSQKTFSGILDAVKSEESAAIGAVSSYEIKCSGKSMLTVTLRDIVSSNSVAASSTQLNGYYAVDIDNIDGNKSAFITGLSPSNVAQVQDALIDCASKNKQLNLTSIDFIDAEKQGLSTKDSKMGWAAATANVLTYTGWAEKAGFKDCDAMTDEFVNDFTNKMCSPYAVYSWLFNGTCFFDDIMDQYIAIPKSGTGNLLNDYSFDNVAEQYELIGAEGMKQLTKDIKSGKGVCIDCYDYQNEMDILNGNAVTCWGYVTDNNYSDDDMKHYSMLLVSDPGSDMTGSADRRTAPNRLSACRTITRQEYLNLEGDDDFINNYQWFIIVNGKAQTTALAYTLKPYSDSLPKETSAKATKDKNKNVDFCSGAITAGQTDDPIKTETIPENSDIYIKVNYCNLSTVDFSGSFQIKYTVTDENGKQVYSRSKAFNRIIDAKSIDYEGAVNNIGKLPAGKYTVTTVINPGQKVQEAYYCNNTATAEFTVAKQTVDEGKLSFNLQNPTFKKNQVCYDVSFSGLSDEQRALIKDAEVTMLISDYYSNESSSEYETEMDFDLDVDDKGIPTKIYLPNQTTARFKLKLEFKDLPMLYVLSNKVSPDYLSVDITNDDDYSEEFTVGENATGFKSGDKLEFDLYNNSSNKHTETISGKYHLEATDDYDKTIKLTNPVSFSLKPGENKHFAITKFDCPLPKGFYEVEIVLEGDFVWSDVEYYLSPTITSGDYKKTYPGDGDINMDGKIDINDVTLLQKYLAYMVKLTEIQRFYADVNNDNAVNIIDATIIQRRIAA